MIHLDTHALVLLYEGLRDKMGPAARKAIDRNEVAASPAAVLELELLHEIGRLKPNSATVLAALAADLGVRVCELPFRTVVEHSISEGWTRDTFDRLIVGNAKAAGATLVTKDQRIQEHYKRAIW